jgi:hypothetical protein
MNDKTKAIKDMRKSRRAVRQSPKAKRTAITPHASTQSNAQPNSKTPEPHKIEVEGISPTAFAPSRELRKHRNRNGMLW